MRSNQPRMTMNALTTTRKNPATIGHTEAPARRSGVALVPGGLCEYGAAVGPADAVLADFDQHCIGADGLYLLEAVNGDAVAWMGCRRVTNGVTGGFRVDQSGNGDWVALPSLESAGLRVAGKVERVLH